MRSATSAGVPRRPRRPLCGNRRRIASSTPSTSASSSSSSSMRRSLGSINSLGFGAPKRTASHSARWPLRRRSIPIFDHVGTVRVHRNSHSPSSKFRARSGISGRPDSVLHRRVATRRYRIPHSRAGSVGGERRWCRRSMRIPAPRPRRLTPAAPPRSPPGCSRSPPSTRSERRRRFPCSACDACQTRA